MNLEILFEDQALVAINKPAGVVVNRAQTVSGTTVQDWMEMEILRLPGTPHHARRAPASTLDTTSHRLIQPSSVRDATAGRQNDKLGMKKSLPSLSDKRQSVDQNVVEEFLNRSGVVHRLDKETSGVLLLAKTPTAFDRLKAQFMRRQVAKEYLALVHGQLRPKQGSINLPIARHPIVRQRFAVRLGGRSAATAYQVVRYYRRSEGHYTLVVVRPTTGRTHQIRVHLQFLKHPLVADPRYLSGKQQEQDRLWCPRLFLHAQSLSFTHPATGERLTLTTPLPSDLAGALQGLMPED